MLRAAAYSFWFLVALCVSAQYPLVRQLTLLDGQQGVNAICLAQDAQGLIWTGSDHGLFRTDGDRTEAMLRTEGDAVTAIAANAHHVVAALASGSIVRCDGQNCDTVWTDTLFRTMPVRSLLAWDDGTIQAGTYGNGIHRWHQGVVRALTVRGGLSDDHVNAQCHVGNGGSAVATDQGIALIDRSGGVIGRFGEEQGAPDNLVLSLFYHGGRLWAGCDRGGVFSIQPDRLAEGARRIGLPSEPGPIAHLVVTPGRAWMGTVGKGTVVCDLSQGIACYQAHSAEQGAATSVRGMLVDHAGGVWWCDASYVLRRGDPDVLIVPTHEGFPLDRITAIADARQGRIVFATLDGVFIHSTSFSESQRFTRIRLPIDSTTQVVALHTDRYDHIWAGTFGKGLYRIDPNGGVTHFDGPDVPVNANVMAIRSKGDSVLFATLDGVYLWISDSGSGQGRFVPEPLVRSGFSYDVLPLRDGSVLVATDGDGVMRLNRDGSTRSLRDARGDFDTFYTLCLDSAGVPWASGPGTGPCRVGADELIPVRNEGLPQMDDVYTMVPFGPGSLVFGAGGLLVFDPKTARLNDLTNEYGLAGAQAELNASAVDGAGAIWLATDRGLIRIAANTATLARTTPAVILSVTHGGVDHARDQHLELAPGEDYLHFRFTGLHYPAPEDLRFAYRLIGSDTTIRYTRDREIAFTRLVPGTYRFEVAGSVGADVADAQWTTYSFTVRRPWWRTPWALFALLGIMAISAIILVRAREARLRLKDRLEKEKVSFQMQVLRSQVNPHFLFNSFNTLIELIEETPGKAVRHVEQLSDFFREILQVRDKELIPLRDELRLVDTYFSLEQRRFGDRIALRTHVKLGAMDALVPPLTVQLLVENALKHNRASDEEPLVIELMATADEVVVSNPYRPRAAEVKSTGFGIDSIRQRFAALTTREVSIGKEDDRFIARIPLIPQNP